VIDPTTLTWYLRNEANAGAPDAGTLQYGAPGMTPITGNWSDTGPTTVGVFDPTTATWFLRFSNTAGAPDITPFAYGSPGVGAVGAVSSGSLPVSGHWTLDSAGSGSGGSADTTSPSSPLDALVSDPLKPRD
jgi:hypothetical protein